MPGGIAHDDDDLLIELPPLDGEGEEGNPAAFEDPLDALLPDGGDALDDSTGDDDPVDEPLDTLDDEDGDDGEEGPPGELDLGAVVTEPLGTFLGEDEPPGVDGEDFGLGDAPDTADDAGEEGFEAEDEALRAEDLPALDADDEGEGEDGLFYDGIVRAADSEIPWDDRGWERVALEPLGHVVGIEVQGAIDLVLKDGRALRSVDGLTFALFDRPPLVATGAPAPRPAKRTLPAGATAHAALPDGSAAVALATLDGRSTLAIAERDGKVRIVADVTAELDLEAEDARIDALAFDPQRAILWAGGPFGLLGFRARPR